MRNKILKLIMFVMVISLIGVGFATWTIIIPPFEKSENGSFVVEDVIHLNVLSNSNYDTDGLRYNKYGFFTQYIFNEEENSFTAKTFSKATYSVDIDLKMVKEKLPETQYVELRLILTDNTNYSNIKSSVYDRILPTIINGPAYETVIKSSNDGYVLSLHIPLTEDSVKVSVEFDFSNVNDKNYFSWITSKEKNMLFSLTAALYANNE